MRLHLLACAALALAACSPAADKGAAAGDASVAAGETESAATGFNQAAAEAELLAWARGLYGVNLIEPPVYFFGDYTGDGAPDALVFAYYASGGSSALLNVSIFRDEGGHMVHHKEVDVYGQEPRDAVFTTGQIKVTTLTPGPNDPHCCPTQPEEWTVNTN